MRDKKEEKKGKSENKGKVKPKKEKKDAGKSNTGLLSAGDIGKMAGVPANTVHHWIARDDSFPNPVDDPTSGKLYRRGAVMAWLRKTGRA